MLSTPLVLDSNFPFTFIEKNLLLQRDQFVIPNSRWIVTEMYYSGDKYRRVELALSIRPCQSHESLRCSCQLAIVRIIGTICPANIGPWYSHIAPSWLVSFFFVWCELEWFWSGLSGFYWNIVNSIHLANSTRSH